MKFTRYTIMSAALCAALQADPEATAVEAEVSKAAPTATQAAIETATEAKPSVEEAEKEETTEDRMKKEQERLALENSLLDEKVKHETAQLRAEVARINAEKELIAARLSLATAKRRAEQEAKAIELQAEAEVSKARAEAATNELKAVQAETAIEITKLRAQIDAFETEEKRDSYADNKPEYLKNPLKEDGTLVISDRRISLNGPISTKTADQITDRIHYFNNKNSTHPIFIVIDECPGGSVMAGYRILKAMEASDAPVHVVVKSYAASMAAAITTLAEESYAYPNSVILHHQISATVFGRLNLTQQEEFLKESQRWWKRFATPIAEKMGITPEEFIKRMYAHSTSGDWSEFGEDAQKLKWVNNIVTGIEETSFLRSPDQKKSSSSSEKSAYELEETVDENGRPVMYLPRINPKDVYFLYNPDGYYQIR